MKKIISLVFIAFLSVNAFAQEDMTEQESPKTDDVKLRLSIGTTAGDDMSRERFATNYSFDFTYLTPIANNFKVGLDLGLTKISTNDNKTISTNFTKGYVSLCGTFRIYNDTGKFYFGSDLGYAYGLGDGGFIYRPKLGFQISDCSGINVTYTDLNSDVQYNSVSLGYEFTF
ncbi:hypothetical protein [Olleya aquimaris]|uniref:Outer membrane protein beta-barrel domain-containing protein n=1 Tax=Olleya aquimaris TaxID=639310 RepID=A0A327RGS2_9FLAO|nr:hypothetical protein [Olleya aquimaris]RAJ16230.1 hypothetical protein LY08_01088 [Olleya aquimaris]